MSGDENVNGKQCIDIGLRAYLASWLKEKLRIPLSTPPARIVPRPFDFLRPLSGCHVGLVVSTLSCDVKSNRLFGTELLKLCEPRRGQRGFPSLVST